MRTEIKRLHDRLGTTIVYVTHDQIEAMTLGTKVAVMRNGVIQQLADPQTIYDKPANIFVAGFIGSPTMNLLKGVLEPDGDALALQIGKGPAPATRGQSRAGEVMPVEPSSWGSVPKASGPGTRTRASPAPWKSWNRPDPTPW